MKLVSIIESWEYLSELRQSNEPIEWVGHSLKFDPFTGSVCDIQHWSTNIEQSEGKKSCIKRDCKKK